LRAAWRAEIARGYRALGMISLADEQARHARACPPRSTLAHKER
jgi:hypothetical protein